MCVVSMVFDEYSRRFDPWPVQPRAPQVTQPVPVFPALPLADLRKLIEEFREAVAAARTVDRLTRQPDCEDPEKAKLEQRVAELERRLAELEAPKEPK